MTSKVIHKQIRGPSSYVEGGTSIREHLNELVYIKSILIKNPKDYYIEIVSDGRDIVKTKYYHADNKEIQINDENRTEYNSIPVDELSDLFQDPIDFMIEFIRKSRDKELNLKERENKILLSYLKDILHKLHAMRYHLQSMETAQQIYINKITSVLQNKPGRYTYACRIDRIAFEFDAFLFQTQACLAIFSRSIGSLFSQNPSNIKKLKNKLKDYQHNGLLANRIMQILEKASDWLNDFESKDEKKSLRDSIAHYRQLRLLMMNTIRKLDGNFFVRPVLLDDMNVIDYANKINRNMKILVKDVYTEVFNYFNQDALELKK